MPPQFYAEHETDRILRERYFPDTSLRGVMVEVGGGTPEFLSMSKHFRDHGWRTIVVEPNPEFVALHRAAGVEVYECACGPQAQEKCSFTVVTQNVEAYGGVVTDHSFSSLALKPGYARLLPKTARAKTIEVAVRRLDEILDAAGVAKIDLLSVDVEGWELEVLQGIDLGRIPVRVIVLENFCHDETYAPFMRDRGYTLDQQIEYNYVFTRSPR